MVEIKKRWNKRKWNETNVDKIPNSPGVYILKNSKGETIYIGKSNQLNRRLNEHLDQQDLRGIRSFQCYQTKSSRDAEILERKLINKYVPRYND